MACVLTADVFHVFPSGHTPVYACCVGIRAGKASIVSQSNDESGEIRPIGVMNHRSPLRYIYLIGRAVI